MPPQEERGESPLPPSRDADYLQATCPGYIPTQGRAPPDPLLTRRKCDEQRPGCGQCKKARIECLGYERQWIFVNITSPPDIGSGGESSTSTSRSSTHSTARRSTPSRTPSARTTPEVTLPASLSRSASEQKYLGLFWDMYLPEGTASVKIMARYSLASWIPAVFDLHKKDPALNKAVMSLCLGTIGSRRDVKWMSEESLKLYVDALSDMNVGLKCKTRRKSDALLLATRTLGLYEVR